MTDLDGRICRQCVGDPILSAWITEEGAQGSCEICSDERTSVPISDLKWRIDEVFKSHFRPGFGADAATIFMKIAGIPESLARSLHEELSELYGQLEARGKSDNHYDAEEFVEDGPIEPPDNGRWSAFQTTIRRDARFFNNEAEAWLDDIFTGLHSQRTWDGDEVVVEYAPDAPKSGFFRARYAPNERKLAEILSDPASQLGPPPNGMAAPGRMNAAGLSVFYGAVEKETCISEIRAPVGSSVVIGRFELIRPIRLLHLDRLARVAHQGSHFDPDYWGKRNRIYILPAIVRQIARPVMPGDEALGYLPTQFVADYLAQRLEPAIDGILFRSTQTNAAGQNVVLFNRACRVEPIDPSIELTVHCGMDEPHEPDLSLSLTVRKRAEPPPTEARRDWSDQRSNTLRLDLDSIEVREIRATLYEAPLRQFSLYRR